MFSTHHRRIFLTTVLACALTPGLASAQNGPNPHPKANPQDRCEAIDIGSLGGSYTFARGVNSAGYVVGNAQASNGESHAFIWRDGVMSDLGTLGGNFSVASAINSAGAVVGASAPPSNLGTQAVVWTSNDTIEVLPPLNGAISNQALDINAQGQVVGTSGGVPVLWTDGTVVALASAGRATGINNQGDVAVNVSTGRISHAFLWREGTLIDLGTLGGTYSSAEGINDLGEVVGQSSNSAGVFHAYVWRNGVMTDLGAVAGSSSAKAINASGVIAGEGQTPSGTRALYWGRSGQLSNLGALPGSSFSQGFAINARGDIVGTSFVAGGTHGVLWPGSASCHLY